MTTFKMKMLAYAERTNVKPMKRAILLTTSMVLAPIV